MKENIYTIPINDAFSADCECPICEFLRNEEKNRIEYSLGASMMEPDERIVSNKLGYCQRHTQMMYDFGNKLSHALVLETRIKHLIDEISQKKATIKKNKKSMFSHKKEPKLFANSETCVVCERLSKITEAFISNIFHLYKKDMEFKQKFFSCKGFCITHFEMLANSAHQHLSADEAYDFLNRLCELETDNLSRVNDDVIWFTKKFDYRYKDEDWKNSKDAVIRGGAKISMYIEEK